MILITAASPPAVHHQSMRRPSAQTGMRVFAVLIFVCLFADLHLKNSADLQQVMWSCYWGAIAIASGILFASDRLVAWGTVFFVGLGLPAWLVGLVLDFHLEVTSVLIHTLPLLAGLIYFRRLSALPARTTLGAWLLYFIPFVLAWNITDPEQMINLSHWNRSAIPSLPVHVWQFYLMLMPLSLLTIFLADRLIDQWLTHRATANHSDKPNANNIAPTPGRQSSTSRWLHE